jgi:glycosyltransferase involved in cell wall biosynthesis
MIESGVTSRGDVEILIIDNCSGDETLESLRSIAETNRNVRILSNPVNIGFERSFVRIIHEVKGRYFLITSDEDVVDARPLDSLLEVLRPERYCVVSSYYTTGTTFSHGNHSRGNDRRSGVYSPSQFLEVANYISGVSFLTSASLAAASSLEPLLEGPASLYIQNFLVAILMLRSPAFSWSTQVCFPLAQLPTSIPKYWGLQARWDQAMEYIGFFEELEGKYPATARSSILVMKQAVVDSIAVNFCWAVYSDGSSSTESARFDEILRTSMANLVLKQYTARELAVITTRRILLALGRRLGSSWRS